MVQLHILGRNILGGLPAPNPSFPQTIKSVTGNQSVIVRGINRWGGFTYSRTSNGITHTYNTDGSLTVKGIASADSFSITASTALSQGIYKTLSVGTYAVSGATNNVTLQVIDTSGNTIVNVSSNTTFTLNTETNVIIRAVVSNGTNISDGVTLKVMLNDGSIVSPYEPYITPTTKQLSLGDIELAKISTYRDYIYRTYGKNLWGGFTEYTGTSAQVTFTFKNDGSIYANGTATGGNANVAVSTLVTNGIYATLKPGTYNVSCANLITGVTLGIYDENTNSLGTSFTLTQETKVIIRIRVATGTSVNNTFKIQLEKGLSVTDYHPFGSGKWYKKANIGKLVLNGSENWSYNSTSAIRFRLNVTTNSYTSAVLPPNLLSDKFIAITWNDVPNYNYAMTMNSSNTVLGFKNIDFTTLNEFKTWVASNNVIVYYILSTPTDTEITDTTLLEQLEEIYNIQSVNGTTIVEINGELPMIIKCRALSK